MEQKKRKPEEIAAKLWRIDDCCREAAAWRRRYLKERFPVARRRAGRNDRLAQGSATQAGAGLL